MQHELRNYSVSEITFLVTNLSRPLSVGRRIYQLNISFSSLKFVSLTLYLLGVYRSVMLYIWWVPNLCGKFSKTCGGEMWVINFFLLQWSREALLTIHIGWNSFTSIGVERDVKALSTPSTAMVMHQRSVNYLRLSRPQSQTGRRFPLLKMTEIMWIFLIIGFTFYYVHFWLVWLLAWFSQPNMLNWTKKMKNTLSFYILLFFLYVKNIHTIQLFSFSLFCL